MFAVIVHGSVGLPLSQIPGLLFVFTEEDGPQAGAASPERLRQSQHSLFLVCSFSLYFLLLLLLFFVHSPFVLSGLLIPVTAPLFPSSCTLSMPVQTAEKLPVGRHLAAESSALHCGLVMFFASHSSGYFTLTGTEQ